MTRLAILRTVGAALLCVCAIALGSALHGPALAAVSAVFPQPNASPTTSGCTSGKACFTESNTGGGPAIKGTASKNTGMVGQTTFVAKSANTTAGVLGQDNSSSGSLDAGVLGTSTNGAGVIGISTNGNGVQAFSTNTSALFVENLGTQDGIQSVALSNDGTNSSTQNDSSIFRGRAGVWGHDDSTDGGTKNYGVTGSSTNGTGVAGSSVNYVGVSAVGGGGSNFDYPALGITAVSSQNTVYLLAACRNPAANPCTGSNSVMYVDFIGNVNTVGGFTANGSIDIGGAYYQNGNCVAGCAAPFAKPAPNHPVARVRRYVPTASVPAVEDFGEAQLVNGRAAVALSHDFANVIDQHASYLVFVTPEGDTNGLYVTQKTPAGFVVVENHGGRSDVGFEYRIVAKPYGESAPRLPTIELRGLTTGAQRAHH